MDKDKENALVIEVMQNLFGKSIRDWNVVNDNRVELLDENDKIIKIITTDILTKIWNKIEQRS